MGNPGSGQETDSRQGKINQSKVIIGAGGSQEFDRELYGSRTSNREQAGSSVKRARKLVKALERALVLMSEDDPLQPAVKDLYAVLWQAEIRLDILEDWYSRTYCFTNQENAANDW